jgi:hypothetical protein
MFYYGTKSPGKKESALGTKFKKKFRMAGTKSYRRDARR